MEDKLRVGVIASTHGIRGEVKVFPTTDDKARFRELDSVLLDTGTELKQLEIENVKFFKQFVILKFRGLDDIGEVEKYRRHELFVPRSAGTPLAAGEYYYADLLDLAVVTETGRRLGVIRDILETGANDVYIVRGDDGGEILLPAIKDCIKNVDLAAGIMTVHLPAGLVD